MRKIFEVIYIMYLRPRKLICCVVSLIFDVATEFETGNKLKFNLRQDFHVEGVGDGSQVCCRLHKGVKIYSAKQVDNLIG